MTNILSFPTGSNSGFSSISAKQKRYPFDTETHAATRSSPWRGLLSLILHGSVEERSGLHLHGSPVLLSSSEEIHYDDIFSTLQFLGVTDVHTTTKVRRSFRTREAVQNHPSAHVYTTIRKRGTMSLSWSNVTDASNTNGLLPKHTIECNC
jgi:hypothetical protein